MDERASQGQGSVELFAKIWQELWYLEEPHRTSLAMACKIPPRSLDRDAFMEALSNHCPDRQSTPYLDQESDLQPLLQVAQQVLSANHVICKLIRRRQGDRECDELERLQNLSAALSLWLQRYNLLTTVGFALEELGITDIPKLEAATEAFRDTRVRAKAKTQRTGTAQIHPLPLLEGALRRKGIRPAEIARFVRACKLSTWGHGNIEGDAEGQDERLQEEEDENDEEEEQGRDGGQDEEEREQQHENEELNTSTSTSSRPAQPQPRRANEKVFWESLACVQDETNKRKFFGIWNNTLGGTINFVQLCQAGTRALAEALKVNVTLTELDLGDNNIGAEGARWIGEGLKANSTLTCLHLLSNNISDEGARWIGEGLKTNSTLMWLRLGSIFGGNNISDEGARWIGEGLRANRTLTKLSLARNNISDEGAQWIGEGLKVNSTLMELGLGGNNISDEGARWIGEGLMTNSTLTELGLPFNQVNNSGARALLRALTSNTTLTKIDIYGNPMSDRLQSRIEDTVERNKRRQEELQALLQFGFVPLTTAKVFVCGDPGIGKTTLIRTLKCSQNKMRAALSRLPWRKGGGDTASKRTAGIQMHRMRVKRSSTFPQTSPLPPSTSAQSLHRASGAKTKCDLDVYDFAGQLEYHVVHELLLADHNAVFVVCVDLTEHPTKLQQRLMHWLSFIKTRLQQALVRSVELPQVVVVGTKADKPHQDHKIRQNSSGMWVFKQGDALLQSEDLNAIFGDRMRVHSCMISLDCRKARDANMQQLRSILHAAWVDVVHRDVEVPKIVDQVAEGLRGCKQQNAGPWRVDDLSKALKRNVPGLAAVEGFNDDIFFKALNYLHVRGDILWFSDRPSLRDHVFVSPPWLLSKVVGPALAPDHFVITHLHPRDGEVSWGEIKCVFGKLMDPNVVVDVLCSMLLCFPLLCDEATTSHTSQRYLLPSRLDSKPDCVWPRSDTAQCFGGRRFLVSSDSGMIFPPGIFPRLQTRMAALLDENMSMWRAGFFGVYGPVECFGRMEGDHTIDLWARGLEDDKEHIWLALSMMLLELEDEVERIDYEHHVLSYRHLSSCHLHPAGYPIEKVEEATEAGDTTTIRRHVDVVEKDGDVTRETVTDNLDNLLREELFLPPIKTTQVS